MHTVWDQGMFKLYNRLLPQCQHLCILSNRLSHLLSPQRMYCVRASLLPQLKQQQLTNLLSLLPQLYRVRDQSNLRPLCIYFLLSEWRLSTLWKKLLNLSEFNLMHNLFGLLLQQRRGMSQLSLSLLYLLKCTVLSNMYIKPVHSS